MTAPSLRSRGALTAGTETTLSLPVGANQVNDLAVVYLAGKPGSGNTNSPLLPSGEWIDVYRYVGADQYDVVAWRKVPAGGLGETIDVAAQSGQVVTKGWWGFVDVFRDVAWPTYGWLDSTGVSGSYGLYTRAALTGGVPGYFLFAVRVRLDTAGVVQWFCGWGGNDMGFGLTAANRMVVYVNNTSGSPIGNVVSTTALPGEAWSRPVWLRGIVESNGQCSYEYSYADVSNYDSIDMNTWTFLDLNLPGSGGGTAFRQTNSGSVYLGARGPAEAGFAGDLMSYYEVSDLLPMYAALSLNFSSAQSGVVVAGSARKWTSTTEEGNDTPIEEFTYTTPTGYGSGDVYTDGHRIWGSDRGFYQVFTLVHQTTSTTPAGEVLAPAGWLGYPERAAKVDVTNVKIATMTWAPTATDGYDGFASTGYTGTYTVYWFSLVIRGVTTPVRPPLRPQAPRLVLGCADSYNLWITDNTYQRTIEQVGWSKIRWERTLDQISKASATIPDRLGGVHCLARVGGLVPWQYGLVIERDDQEVWRGPVVNVSRRGTDIQVEAADVLARYQKRLLIRGSSFEYKQADAGVVFRDVITTHAALASDAWTLQVPQVNADVPISRTLRPRELKLAWDLLSELMDTAIDAYVMNGVLYVWEANSGWCYQDDRRRVFDGPYNVNYDLVYGTFTEEAWTEKPDWAIDGPGQANYVAVPGVESGEYGFRRIEIVENVQSQATYGVLDYVDVDRVELPEDTLPTIEEAALHNRALTLAALRAFAPAVVSGGGLSPQAPIDMEHLRPGALWKIDVWDHGFGQLLTVGRLSRVEVDVSVAQSGITESVKPTLTPPGWEDEES